MISPAPWRAASTSGTFFSSFTKGRASSLSGVLSFCAKITSASGFNPFASAIVAFVCLFGLNGRYISSSSVIVLAFSKLSIISGVIFSCSVISLMMSFFLSSKLRRYVSLSEKSLKTWSSQLPVISLRYLAINGIVQPSSKRPIMFPAWVSVMLNSALKILIKSIMSPLNCFFYTNTKTRLWQTNCIKKWYFEKLQNKKETDKPFL